MLPPALKFTLVTVVLRTYLLQVSFNLFEPMVFYFPRFSYLILCLADDIIGYSKSVKCDYTSRMAYKLKSLKLKGHFQLIIVFIHLHCIFISSTEQRLTVVY